MEVTCERCSTVYDFDDALVSERGTTVKCTTCSHQFKVRRAVPTTGPDVWIVRTVDGREIEFSALRDLQAAIYDNRVTREDVLVKGSSRPRRLGSIAELEPFFNRGATNAPRRARTLAGAGAAPPQAVTAQRNETSVVFSLPNLMQPGGEKDGPVSVRRSTLPPPPPLPVPSGAIRDGSQTSMRRGSIPPPTPRSGSDGSPPPIRRGSIPPPPPTSPSGRRAPTTNSSNPGGWFGAPSSVDYDEEWSSAGIERISALPPPPMPPRRSAPPPPPMFPPAEPPPPPAETMKAPRMFPDPDPTKISKQPTAPVTPPPPTEAEGSKTATAASTTERTTSSSADKLVADKPDVSLTNDADSSPNGTSESSGEERSSKPTASTTSMQSPSSERLSGPGSNAPSMPPGSNAPSIPPGSNAPSMPPSRFSDPFSEPRHSAATPSRRAGAARWIVGFVLLGCTALAAITIGPKLMSKPGSSPTQLDARVATFLDQGDRAMNEGDLEGANDAFVKASALADKDPRVELRLARLSIVRGDIPWLKVRLLADSDPDLANTRRELVLAAARAHQAAERFQAIAPNEPDATRCRIDALRLQGNVAEARKLVASLLKPTGVSNDEVLFALLDLAEPSPTWATVIERLSNAARSEQNLGHARSMLIYALVQSGDVTRAKAELDQLVAMPRPHPLIGAFRAYVAEAEKTANGGAKEEDAAAPADDTAALQSANEAMTNGDLEKASGLLKDLETRLPNDANVLTASGKLALKKKDRAAAAKYFDRALAIDKNQFDAMAELADIKWDSGEKQGASILYRQIIERAGAESPHLAIAKERFSAFADSINEGPGE